MHAIRIKIALLAMTLALTGCITKPEKVAKAAQPNEALVIHQLELTPSKNGQSTHAIIDFTNQTGRELSYVMFKATAFDDKGHIVRANKSGAEHAFLRVAGPFSKDSRSGGQRWEKVWTQGNTVCLVIEGAELIFADSSVEELVQNQIKVRLSIKNRFNCDNLQKTVAKI